MRKFCYALLISMTLAAPSFAAMDATGTWSGTCNSTVSGAQPMTLSLMQEGNSVTGTYSSAGAVGSISGKVNDNTITMSITLTTPGCTGTFDGTGMIDTQAKPNALSFKYSGASSCGGNESGTGNLTKRK